MSELKLPRKYGQVAYEAYITKAKELDPALAEMWEQNPPTWWGLGERDRMAWDAAFDASVEYAARIPA